jgi:hypothetical protein
MINRRSFIKYVSGTGFLYFGVGPDGPLGASARLLPGGTFDPGSIPKYQTPLLFPRATARAGKRNVRVDRNSDDELRDARNGARAVLPGPGPARGDRSGTAYFELPIAIVDRAFNVDGSLFDPDIRSLIRGEESARSPRCGPDLFGNTMTVNGGRWPFQTVQQRRYRLRVFNGCQSRFLFLDFSGIPGVKVWQIGNEGGFLVAPVDITSHHNQRVLLGPAERADCIVDFSDVPAGDHVLGNLGPDEPFSGGVPGVDFATADPGTTGQVLQFRVAPATAVDPSTPPQFLRLPAIAPAPAATVTRRLALLEEMSMYFADSPRETLLGVVDGDPGAGPAEWTAHQ